jgi:hypothetical protein
MARERTADFGLLAGQLTKSANVTGFVLARHRLVAITAYFISIYQVLNA